MPFFLTKLSQRLTPWVVVVLCSIPSLSAELFAHPGRKAADGCHYCKTNCAKWGERAGARHCHGQPAPRRSPPPRSKSQSETERDSPPVVIPKESGSESQGTSESTLRILRQMERRQGLGSGGPTQRRSSDPKTEVEESRRLLKVTVVEVVDGDTVVLEREGIREEVDLDGIDAPELDQPFGKLARSALRKHVELTEDLFMADPVRGTNGRVRGRIIAGEVDLSVTLAEAGLAWALPWHEDTVRAETDAWSDRRGLWTERQPVAPWRWRALQTPRDTGIDR